jgi:hypothetical protein
MPAARPATPLPAIAPGLTTLILSGYKSLSPTRTAIGGRVQRCAGAS